LETSSLATIFENFLMSYHETEGRLVSRIVHLLTNANSKLLTNSINTLLLFSRMMSWLTMTESERISKISRGPDATMAGEEVCLRDQDICCGRGKGASKHPGNQMFQNIIQLKAEEFSECSKKLDKSRIIAAIVHELLLCGIRFLKRDSSEDKWIVLAEGLAREKTGHAIRDHIVTKSKKGGMNVAKKVIKEKAKASKTRRCRQMPSPALKSVDSSELGDFRHKDDPRKDDTSALFNMSLSRRDLLPIPSLPISLEPPSNYRKGHGICDTVDLILMQDRFRQKSSQKLSQEEILEVCADLLSQTSEEGENPELDKSDVQTGFAKAESAIFPEDWL
jgi:hypothetical protein